MAINEGMMSSARGDWRTPDTVLEPLLNSYTIHLDPCAGADTCIGRINYRLYDIDGLTERWMGTVYVNPPYGRGIGKWIDRCHQHRDEPDGQVIALVPARVDTKWFQTCWRADAICFIRRRLTFVGAPSAAPFPSALVYWGADPAKFTNVFSHLGKVIYPW